MWYFIIGVFLVMFIDYHTHDMEDDVKLTTSERLITVIIWPVLVIMVIIEYYNQFKDE